MKNRFVNLKLSSNFQIGISLNDMNEFISVSS